MVASPDRRLHQRTLQGESGGGMPPGGSRRRRRRRGRLVVAVRGDRVQHLPDVLPYARSARGRRRGAAHSPLPSALVHPRRRGLSRINLRGSITGHSKLRKFLKESHQVDLCGHATLAAAHFLFTSSLVKCNEVEFVTRSGILSAQRIYGLGQMNGAKLPSNGDVEQFSVELDLPVVPVVECDSAEVPVLPGTLKGASVVDVKKTAGGDLLVELASGKDVADIKPQFDELRRCAGRGVIVTGPAPDGSGFDIFSRFFCPKLGINEASPRGGRLDLLLEEETRRVKIRGEAVTVMVGTLLAQ